METSAGFAIGDRVRFQDGQAGTIVGVRDDGSVAVETGKGVREVLADDIEDELTRIGE